MDLSQDQAEALFPSDRGEDTSLEDMTHHVTIEQRVNDIRIITGDETYDLNDREVQTLLDTCDLDSIWHIISNSVKVLEYVQENCK